MKNGCVSQSVKHYSSKSDSFKYVCRSSTTLIQHSKTNVSFIKLTLEGWTVMENSFTEKTNKPCSGLMR